MSSRDHLQDATTSGAPPVSRPCHAGIIAQSDLKEYLVANRLQLARVDDLGAVVKDAALVPLVQNHAEYDADQLAKRAQRFFDTRGVTTGEESHRL
jgi:hypothetical protein